MSEWKGRTALVTGATGGLGTRFAEQLAERGCHLVLTSRSSKRLRQLADSLRVRHGVDAEVVAMDLAEPSAAELLARAVTQRGHSVDILINNAGFGVFGDFLDTAPDRLNRMLLLDVVTPTELAWHFGRSMAERGRGWILNVSSIGAYQPSPTYAAYSAAKSYMLNLSGALRRELRPRGIKVTALSPGITDTGFLDASGQSPSLYQRLVMMQSEPVVRAGLKALARGRESVVPGLFNKLTVFTVRFLPRTWQAAIAEKSMKIG